MPPGVKILSLSSKTIPISHKFKTLKSTLTSIVSNTVIESKIIHPELLFDICKKYFPEYNEARLADELAKLFGPFHEISLLLSCNVISIVPEFSPLQFTCCKLLSVN